MKVKSAWKKEKLGSDKYFWFKGNQLERNTVFTVAGIINIIRKFVFWLLGTFEQLKVAVF